MVKKEETLMPNTNIKTVLPKLTFRQAAILETFPLDFLESRRGPVWRKEVKPFLDIYSHDQLEAAKRNCVR